jgi:hypothetical protein
MLPSRIPKHLRSPRRLGNPPRLLHDHSTRPRRIRPILEETLQTARKHLLKPHNQHTIRRTMRNHIPTHEEARRAGRTVVVDVVYGDTRHAELVEDALAACRVAVAVACYALVDVVVVDVGVEHGFDAGFEAEFGVVDFAARFYELGHAYAEDVDGLFLANHGGGCEV